jgi:hypothetical protein
MTAQLRIDAIVAPEERLALSAAAEQLRDCLSHATQGAWSIDLRFCDALDAIDEGRRADVVIASLLPELARDAVAPTIQARWQQTLAAVTHAPPPSVVICTIFHHVPDATNSEEMAALRERIRRINLVAVELSHDTGAVVADIDRALSRLGARSLATDFTLRGPLASRVAGHVIVSAVLAAGVDHAIPPEVQERALIHHGQLRGASTAAERLGLPSG